MSIGLPQPAITEFNSKVNGMDFQDLLKRLELVNEKDHPDLEAAFEMFETEKGSGRITPVSLWRTLSRYGDSSPTYSQCMAMVESFDTNRDGELDYDDFHEMLTVTSSQKGKLILNLEDIRKLLRISQLEKVKSKLRQIEQDHILHSEFIQICSQTCNLPINQSLLELAKILDESGTVVILGDIVFLRPDQVRLIHTFNLEFLISLLFNFNLTLMIIYTASEGRSGLNTSCLYYFNYRSKS